MRANRLLGAFVGFALCAGPTLAAHVNVSQQWCGGGCSEGHNDTECVCTYDSTKNPRTREAWVSCKEVRCCDLEATYCDLGYVNEDPSCWYGEQPGVYCAAETPRGWLACEVPCGQSGCHVLYNMPHFEVVNEQGPNFCTRSNETCDWWAPWTCFEPCDLANQSPWDDGGSGLVCG